MPDSQTDKPDTRQRVLDSAVAIFAEKGFRDATIHEICEQAEANIAAVNYYFGSKENLYAEAWRAAFRRSVEAHPRDGGVPASAPPLERLRGRIRSLIMEMADANNQSFTIAQKEMANPTDLLREVQRECLEPLRAETAALVRELLGPRATEQQAQFCEMSIMGQCFGMARWARARREELPPGAPAFSAANADAYAEHVVRFSLAGIRAVRELSEQDDGAAQPRSRCLRCHTMRRLGKGILTLAVLLALAGAGFLWLRHTNGDDGVVLRTAPLKRGDLLVTISATGTVEPEEVVDVGAQVAGQIVSFGKDADGKTR